MVTELKDRNTKSRKTDQFSATFLFAMFYQELVVHETYSVGSV